MISRIATASFTAPIQQGPEMHFATRSEGNMIAHAPGSRPGSLASNEEGCRHVLDRDVCRTTGHAFQLALFAALVSRRQTARCSGIAPGVSMLVEAHDPGIEPAEIDDWCESIWKQIAPVLRPWLDASDRQETLDIALPFVFAHFAHDAVLCWLPAASQIDVACDML